MSSEPERASVEGRAAGTAAWGPSFDGQLLRSLLRMRSKRVETSAVFKRKDAALDAAHFADLMRPLGPLPAAPRIGVALSGGSDSLALTLLLHNWTQARGGAVTALIVDHGLRDESSEEAAAVARQATALGVSAQILRWQGSGGTVLQARARDARYARLSQACRDLGLLFLALGHHRDDQAETFLLRAESDSGPAGLAAMGQISVLPDLVLLRPLLSQPKAALQDYLRQRGVPWVEDPSNRQPRFRRVALRQQASALGRQGLDSDSLAEAARCLGLARRSLEAACLSWLGRHAQWHRLGYLSFDRAAFLRQPALLRQELLSILLRAVGGRAYPPRSAALAQLADCAGGPATLAGCRLLSLKGRLAVVREERGALALPLRPGFQGLWDRRFTVRVGETASADLQLTPLGRQAWERLEARPKLRETPLPAAWSQPCVHDAAGPLALPLLGWTRPGCQVPPIALRFTPADLPGSALFTVACHKAHII
ncbi:MAG: tRNA lysidine(34) synthetase TilS [Pseudomonadota bacterium]